MRNFYINKKEKRRSNFSFAEDQEKNVLLIDDDPSFRAFMESISSSSAIKITAFESLHHLPSPRKIKNYDAVILDYFMDKIDGLRVAQYIYTFFPTKPVMLISGKNVSLSDEAWPESVKFFCPKDLGGYRILQRVNELFSVR